MDQNFFGAIFLHSMFVLRGSKYKLILNADLQIIHSFLAAEVNALKISVQKCQKLSKIGQKLTKIGPKMSEIIQIWSKIYKKSQISQLFLPAQIISGS